jgi:hypothetical protein
MLQAQTTIQYQLVTLREINNVLKMFIVYSTYFLNQSKSFIKRVACGCFKQIESFLR